VAEALARGLEVIESIPDFSLDYLAVVEPQELSPLREWVPGARAIVAGRFPEARLIDNLEVYP